MKSLDIFERERSRRSGAYDGANMYPPDDGAPVVVGAAEVDGVAMVVVVVAVVAVVVAEVDDFNCKTGFAFGVLAKNKVKKNPQTHRRVVNQQNERMTGKITRTGARVGARD